MYFVFENRISFERPRKCHVSLFRGEHSDVDGEKTAARKSDMILLKLTHGLVRESELNFPEESRQFYENHASEVSHTSNSKKLAELIVGYSSESNVFIFRGNLEPEDVP